MNTFPRLSSSLATICLLVLAQQPVWAEPAANRDQQQVTRTVRFGDLDLSTAAGQKTLQGRVQIAVKQVCREIVPGIPGQFIQNGICRNSLMQQALAQVARLSGESVGQYAARQEWDSFTLMADRRTP
jgi:UrcA family protein